MVFTTATIVQFSAIFPMVLKWQSTWVANRHGIIMLTAVNTVITTGNEFISRQLTAPFSSEPAKTKFLVRQDDGALKVNRQSLTNILMTIFASLLGGPVYFMRSRWHRFLFFVGFGTVNSFASQALGAILRDGVLLVVGKRLLFDFVYNGTVKFCIFEFGRPLITGRMHCAASVGAVRLVQDFGTTTFRVIALNVVGLWGL